MEGVRVFVTQPYSIHAIQWDGTPESTQQIVDWLDDAQVERKQLSDNTFYLRIKHAGIVTYLGSYDWLVCDQYKRLRKCDELTFNDTYKPVP